VHPDRFKIDKKVSLGLEKRYDIFMKVVIQRVKKASVSINDKVIAKINEGLLLLVAFENTDQEKIKLMAEKILQLRIFSDKMEKMNLSLLDIKGEILVVPQFTLMADCSRGNRPYFGNVAPPEIAEELFNRSVTELRKSELIVEMGRFGDRILLTLTNDGPITIIL